MKRGIVVPTIIFTIAFLFLVSCSKKQEEQSKERQQPSLTQGTMESNSTAGIHWSVSKRWIAQPLRTMRVATYAAPAAEGDAEGGECAVFYFGNNQGGNIDANIDRWAAQFENAGKPSRSSREVNGLKVTLVQISGTYLAPSGPMMQSQGKKENYRLLGAIVEAPEGLVFFKYTGPTKTIAATETEFNDLVDSMKKQE